ncbi:Two-component response regulator, YesN/AraC family, consists of REC and AraC-type DNA-binding domains [Paenibacillus catalpae]|uniref:Two-component response regulator, YesN/AraC family, consists of REC and AraC-type DNA-binding domains n=1 Tax=Paenibacillus catalpae TaxID=1045775 RepID=A0A1I2BSQ1_9BACL|nr:response regulator [Paenibacillus catalpae]SFE59089.1 Two-component response regulator, YesN/AraC family, consists of REC and AraC-type DNA-binding domains [Paenibacillus catalpae]
MLKVLIVEDEMFVRIGFKNSVNWEKFGMMVCADVSNGQEAWEIYLKMKPDIIITDLNMPVMSGMELIEQIRQIDNKTRIVILSCLEEFSLVQKAMRYGVSNYILKLTMEPEEIDEVLVKVSEEYKSHMRLQETKGVIHNPDTLKENIINNFLFYPLYSEQEFTNLVLKQKLRLSPENLIVSVMEINNFGLTRSKFKDSKGELIRYTILNVLNEMLIEWNRGEVFAEKEDRYVFLFSFIDVNSQKEIRETLLALMDHIRRVLNRYFNVSVTFGISRKGNRYGDLKALLSEAAEAVSWKFFLGTERSLFKEEYRWDNFHLQSQEKMEKLLTRWGNVLPDKHAERKAIVQSFFDSDVKDPKLWIQLFVRLLLIDYNPLLSIEAKALDTVSLAAEQVSQCETLEDCIQTVYRLLASIEQWNQTSRQLSKEVGKAIKYILAHYRESCSISELADTLQVSPNYLSSLFRKETALTFTDYLTQVRIDKAKELLLSTQLKSYEIAELTGFSDDSYFSRTFKNKTGVRPNEFRKMKVHEERGRDNAPFVAKD